MNWSEILQVIIPAVVGLILGGAVAVAAIEVLKQIKELLQEIEDATKDKKITKEEIAEIAKEAKDVKVSWLALVESVKRLFGKKK